MSLYQPFDLGNNPGPQPWQPPGMFGPFMPLLLQMIGGTDSQGNPFLKMPTFGADVRTVQERMFAQNTLMASRQIQAMEEMTYKSSINNLIGLGPNNGGIAANSFLAQAAVSAGSPLMSMFMQSQDPTYGAMKQGLLGNSAQIMAMVTGGRTFANPAQNAAAIGSLYSAMYNNTWGQDFSKKLGFTYGLTESEMMPLVSRVAMTGAFNTDLNNVSAARLGLDSLKEQYNATDKGDTEKRARLEREIKAKEDEVNRLQKTVDSAVERTMTNVNRTISSMKGLFGTAENAAEALETMFGRDAFGANGGAKRDQANTLSNQLISMATRYGMAPGALGNMMMRTIGNTATAMGFSAEEQQVGFGTGISSWMSVNAAFSAGQAANGDPDKMKKFALGYSQRMSSAGASQNMKLHTMLQYAINKGLVGEGDSARLRAALSSGDVGTRQAAIRELFDSFGGYEQGMQYMNSTNAQAMMQESFTEEQKHEVANAVTQTMGNEGRMSVENARNRRVSKAARSALRQQGFSGKQIKALESEGAVEGMTAALNELGDQGAEILSGADEVYQNAIAEGKSPAEAQRRKANYMREAAQNFLSASDAEKVISGGNKGAADKLGGAGSDDPERAEIAKRIAFAKSQRKTWSKEERKILRDAERALKKGDKAQAKSLLEQFISKTGKRGQMVAKKDFSQKATPGSADLKELDQAAAADAAGLGPAAAATLGEGTATGASQEDVEGGKSLTKQSDDTAAAGENSAQNRFANIAKHGLKGLFMNDEASGEEFDKSPIGKFLNELGKLLRELYGEFKADTAKDQGSA